MPKGRRKKTITRPSVLMIALLLVKIILIKVGQLPLLPLRSLANISMHGRKTKRGRSRTIPIPLVKQVPTYTKRAFTNITAFLNKKRNRGRPKKFRLSKRAKIAICLAVFFIFVSSYTLFILTAAYALPNPNKLSSSALPITTEIYDRNGILLYRIYDGSNRTLVKLPEVPKSLIQATLAIEDQNFYRHFGIDFSAIARALYRNITTGSHEGASTITQQLIKNSLLTPEKTYTRKMREGILALWAEIIYSKEQILQMYLNEAPYGGSIMGIAAASQTYFDKSPSELTLEESSYLAGLPASPTQFSPYGSSPKLAKQRQKEVLQQMVENKYITQFQADEAYKQDLNIKPLKNNILAPHFVFYIRDYLSEKLGPKLVSQGGLKVYTTLDLQLQQKVEEIVKNEVDSLQNLNVKNGAAMVTDAVTGQILAMVGSRSYHYPGFGNYNAALALRQPGSSIKPITYAAALKNGFSPSNILLDTPVTFRDEWGNGYSPVNYDGTFHGPVTLRQALGSSLNIPAVKLLATVGIEAFAQTARDLGITTIDNPKQYGLSLTLGSAEVKMIEMMGVYGAFSQLGQLNPPTGILEVTDSSGYILEEYENSSKQTLLPETAFLITHILSDDNARKMAFGANSLLKIKGYEVAVKTGTSDSKRDNWTFGYTPKYVVGVWVGNPDNTPMNPNLASGITGAAPIWNKIMHKLLDNTTPLAFQKPSEIKEVAVDGKKDLGVAGNIPKAMVRVQKKEDKLIFSDPFSSYATPSALTNQPLSPATFQSTN
ncbi:penicillin-binding protein [Candidatus Daviesbacteria bacterium]|nr:penicillin-binding protein [Candidatus Daviesbacteria bacterium]